MPIFDLINAFTNKNQNFAAFLQAYSEIRQMKKISQNLNIISDAIQSEYESISVNASVMKSPRFSLSKTTSKCLEYYITNEMDKVILQLTQTEDLEQFYCSIFHCLPDFYLESEFFVDVWNQKNFPTLAKFYAEKALSLNIWNLVYANYLTKNFHENTESIIILTESNCYIEHFTILKQPIIDLINRFISIRNREVVELLEFAVFFEDKTGMDILNNIKIESSNKINNLEQDNAKLNKNQSFNQNECIDYKNNTINCNNSRNHCLSNTFNTFEDVSRSINTPISIESCHIDFPFFLLVFKRLKSIKIRQFIISYLPEMFKENYNKSIDFLISLIKIDCFTVALSLNQHEEPEWEIQTIFNLLKNYLYEEINTDNEDSITCQASIDQFPENTIIFDMANSEIDNTGDNVKYNKDILNGNIKDNEDILNDNRFILNNNIQESASILINSNLNLESSNNCDTPHCSSMNINQAAYLNAKLSPIFTKLPSNQNDLIFLIKTILNDTDLEQICLKWKAADKILKKSNLFHFLLTIQGNIRIFTFLLFVNENLIFNNLKIILNNMEEKEKKEYSKLLIRWIIED